MVLVLVFYRRDVLVQRLDGCCSEEVEGGWCCKALEVVDVDGASVFGVVGFVYVLADYSRGLCE